MKKITLLLLILAAFFAFISHNTVGAAATQDAGEALFKKHCSACHPKASKLKSVTGMVNKMRNPPPYMPSFDEYKISDNEAQKIADYIYRGSE